MKYQRIEDMRIDQDLTIKEISALLECNRAPQFVVREVHGGDGRADREPRPC